MIRSTTAANTRAIDKILMGRKPVETCGCDTSSDLQRRIAAALPFIIGAIGHLDRIPSTTVVGDQGPDAATLALINARKALSALSVESEP